MALVMNTETILAMWSGILSLSLLSGGAKAASQMAPKIRAMPIPRAVGLAKKEINRFQASSANNSPILSGHWCW